MNKYHQKREEEGTGLEWFIGCSFAIVTVVIVLTVSSLSMRDTEASKQPSVNADDAVIMPRSAMPSGGFGGVSIGGGLVVY